MNKKLLGVDIGGTNFNIGLVNKSVIVEELISPVDVNATKGFWKKIKKDQNLPTQPPPKMKTSN